MLQLTFTVTKTAGGLENFPAIVLRVCIPSKGGFLVWKIELSAGVVAKENGCKFALRSTFSHSHCQRDVENFHVMML
jgi:hypothetical protein